LLLILSGSTFAQGQSATATFSNGAVGSVTIEPKRLYFYINVENVNQSLLPNDCWTDGLMFHLHANWTYADNGSRFGAVDCGLNYTGDHFDPWAACSPDSSNIYCSNNGGCINTSDYSCSQKSYKTNIFSCEIGDWSGKYGVVNISNNSFEKSASSFWEIEPSDAIGKSIVFHCNTPSAQRVFCAPFVSTTNSNTNITINSSISLMQSGLNLLDTIFNISSSNSTQVIQSTNLNYVTAYFDSGIFNCSYINFYKNGSFEASFDLNLNATNASCSGYVYRIYDSWKDSLYTSLTGNNCSSNVVGNVYDPTRTCFSNSSDSEYCYDEKLCNSTSYTYSCNPSNNLYGCSPSDLSGRWNGVITNNNSTYSISGVDRLLMPLELMIGKSIVIECENNYTPVACAQITTLTTKKHKRGYFDNMMMSLIARLQSGMNQLEQRTANLESEVDNLENKLKKHLP